MTAGLEAHEIENRRSGRLTGPITQTHVWFVELDDFDMPFLVRYRIVSR